jgi:O-succinylbenzoate synthase
MKIDRVELLELRMPLVHFFETSFGRTTERRIVLVRAEADGRVGWGEVTCGETPFYSHETPDTAWHILRDFLIPWAFEKSWSEPAEIARRFQPVRGHNMAKAALENALWDIEAQRQGLPLARLVGGTRDEIACGVSIGIQNSPQELLEKIQQELEAGYQRIKVKIKPGWDIKILEIIRSSFPDIGSIPPDDD